MTHVKTTLLGFVFAAIAAPAMAGGFTFELPRLTFPDPNPPVTSQNCTTPATLDADSCKAK